MKYLPLIAILRGITPNKVLECIRINKINKIKALIVMYHGGYPEFIKEFYDRRIYQRS